MGKARRFVASVKADIDRELKTEELRRLLDKQAQDVAHLKEMLDETRSAMSPEHLISTAQSSSPSEQRTVPATSPGAPASPAAMMPPDAPVLNPPGPNFPSQPADDSAHRQSG